MKRFLRLVSLVVVACLSYSHYKTQGDRQPECAYNRLPLIHCVRLEPLQRVRQIGVRVFGSVRLDRRSMYTRFGPSKLRLFGRYFGDSRGDLVTGGRRTSQESSVPFRGDRTEVGD